VGRQFVALGQGPGHFESRVPMRERGERNCWQRMRIQVASPSLIAVRVNDSIDDASYSSKAAIISAPSEPSDMVRLELTQRSERLTFR
jgi:hypothetical protein